MEKYTELARCVENVEKDASKFFVNGNKAAGTRARKHLQELKQLAQDLRVLIQDTKNDKSRVAPGAHDESPAPDADLKDEQQAYQQAYQPQAAQQGAEAGEDVKMYHHGGGVDAHAQYAHNVHAQGPYEDESNINVGF